MSRITRLAPFAKCVVELPAAIFVLSVPPTCSIKNVLYEVGQGLRSVAARTDAQDLKIGRSRHMSLEVLKRPQEGHLGIADLTPPR